MAVAADLHRDSLIPDLSVPPRKDFGAVCVYDFTKTNVQRAQRKVKAFFPGEAILVSDI